MVEPTQDADGAKQKKTGLIGRVFRGFARVRKMLAPAARRRAVFVLGMMLCGMALESC